jgi:hypothetical protein
MPKEKYENETRAVRIMGWFGSIFVTVVLSAIRKKYETDRQRTILSMPNVDQDRQKMMKKKLWR